MKEKILDFCGLSICFFQNLLIIIKDWWIANRAGVCFICAMMCMLIAGGYVDSPIALENPNSFGYAILWLIIASFCAYLTYLYGNRHHYTGINVSKYSKA